ncbi:MAG: hypothetical protein COA79_00835 [Planctomycetota bacterium]|nr:MAG: hypothetical protein COA79_00835 [Planctomycetota bacterium]
MKIKISLLLVFLFILSVGAFKENLNAEEYSQDELKNISFNVTALFRAYRKTISSNKGAIHTPKKYFENVEGRLGIMHKNAKQHYRVMTKKSLKEDGIEGKIVKDLQQAVDKVIRLAASGKLGLAWKGKNDYVKKWDGKLLPARFAAYVAEEFNKNSKEGVKIKLTTSKQLLVNENNAPDEWESKIIEDKLISSKSYTGKPIGEDLGKSYRYILPEFYAPSCIKCHGTNEGQEGLKIHPSKLKRKIGDFAGAISVFLDKTKLKK